MAASEYSGINALEPSEARARAVGMRIQQRLAGSLRYILEELNNAGDRKSTRLNSSH